MAAAPAAATSTTVATAARQGTALFQRGPRAQVGTVGNGKVVLHHLREAAQAGLGGEGAALRAAAAAAAAAGAAAVVVMVSGRDRVGMRRLCVFVCVVAVFCMVCRGGCWVVGRV